MKILCATDFSERSEAAVRIAAALARWSRGSLEVVHVLPRVVELCHVHERTLPSPAFAYESSAGVLDHGHRMEIERALRALAALTPHAAKIITVRSRAESAAIPTARANNARHATQFSI